MGTSALTASVPMWHIVFMICSEQLKSTNSAWSADRVEALSEHRRLGLTAAQSAILLGTTKNAVIAKRYRLGLVGVAKVAKAAPCLVAAPVRRAATVIFRAPPAFPAEPLPEMDQPAPLDSAPVTLADRRSDQCAWPLGRTEEPADWRTLFCGAPVVRASFCACHAARAYQ
jgi:hypothetical protein